MNCEELDKRTKAYKKCLQEARLKEMMAKDEQDKIYDQGLGDTIERFTKATGIKKAVDYVFDKLGKDCGCDARKEKLNKLFRYEQPKCLTEIEYDYLDKFFKSKKEILTAAEQTELLAIHNRIFSKAAPFSNCSPCVRRMVTALRKVYDQYD